MLLRDVNLFSRQNVLCSRIGASVFDLRLLFEKSRSCLHALWIASIGLGAVCYLCHHFSERVCIDLRSLFFAQSWEREGKLRNCYVIG